VSVAPDGSPVELYLRLPARGEAELVHEHVELAVEVLELGCGVGRVTHELIRLGHPVVAVDESPEMLAHVRSATTVCARIEDLSLGRRFRCVLLMSNLVNSDEEQRRAFLETCARHVEMGGVVLIERHEPGWGARGNGAAAARRSPRLAARRPRRRSGVSATVRYGFGARAWHHPFTAWVLDDDEIAGELGRAGLQFLGTIDDAGRWVKAGLYSGA
jgi:SAM-dependent methyltransferase